MLIRRPADIKSSEITPRSAYLDRRAFLAGAAAAGLSALPRPATAQGGVLSTTKSRFSTDEQPSRFRDVTHYNNFYEFGTRKSDPAYFAHALTTKPWSVTVDGMVRTPTTFALDDLLKLAALEERIYRLRCVEGWSMVIPWAGYPLGAILQRVEPLASARYVAFETVHRPSEMRGQRKAYQVLEWPYREGLRLDEALHPLTIVAFGLYGRMLPNQNGAPVRLVVPWKYGFKSIKSIVRITLTETMPATSWSRQSPSAYGFYANVNPAVDHPQWSQANERRIGYGTGLYSKRRPTELFNGYGPHVAHLYDGMDLTKHF